MVGLFSTGSAEHIRWPQSHCLGIGLATQDIIAILAQVVFSTMDVPLLRPELPVARARKRIKTGCDLPAVALIWSAESTGHDYAHPVCKLSSVALYNSGEFENQVNVWLNCDRDIRYFVDGSLAVWGIAARVS